MPHSVLIHYNSMLFYVFFITFLFIILLCLFINRRFKIQLKLMESEDRYRSLVEVSPKSILVYQEDKIIYANPAANQLFGASHDEELVGISLLEMIHPDSKEILITNIKKISNNEKLALHEYKFHTLDGRTILTEAVGANIMFNGKPALMAVGNDITEKKNLQEQLKINKQRYKSLFEYHADAVYSFDLEGNFTSANKACETLSGYNPSELMEKNFTELVFADDFSQTVRAFELTCKDGGSPQNINIRLNRKDGKIIHLNITSIPIIVDELIVGVYGIAKDITQQIKSQEMIRHLAYHDYLTGLPNRNMLDSRLSKELDQAADKNNHIAILFIDLDRFKEINDTLGHSVGDLLLVEVAERLKTAVFEKDIVFRQGGDEFIVILDNADRDIAKKVAKRILEGLSATFKLKNYDIFTSSSIGISLFPENGQTVETLVKHADFAMYQAKKAGKNTYRFYSSQENEGNINPLLMEMELHKAIEHEELILHYQPKVNLKTGKIIGAEALIRWNHSEWGMVPPGDFIPIAEETGLIIPIGEWVLFNACAQNKKWQADGLGNMIISVNLSARQFSQSKIVQTVERVLKETGLEPQYLELEITESMTMDICRTITTLQDLKKLGVLISIDDFGTGFSSLNYLKQFPVDTLKIDQSFVRELHNNSNDETIVKAIISMAHTLQLNVVAEGIETREQLVFLQQHLCDGAQGYFFSKPRPAKELSKEFFAIEGLVKEFGISQDINDRMWMEESLRIARKDLQETVRRQQGLTLKYKKIDGKFIHTLCDGELLYRFGLSPDQLIGKELADFLPYGAAKEKTVFYQKAWDGDENVTYEAEINGIHYLAALSPIKRGEEVVEVIGSCIDITTLKETEIALRESQEMYRLIAENMTDLIVIFDLEGKILYASPSHESILGYPSSYYEGRRLFDEFHPDDQGMHSIIFEETIKNKQSSHLEVRMSLCEGGWKLFESMLTPIFDENGSVRHIVGVAKDITDKRIAEELLWKSEKLSVVGELAAGVAHEIRNPITSIKGFFKLFQQGMIEPKYFDVIHSEFDHIEEIINEFLTLAKTQAIDKKTIKVKKLIDDVTTLLESETNLKNIQIHKYDEESFQEILGDPNQLKQVFINLANNSIEAMPNGGNIHIEAQSEGSHVIIKFSDDGVGMSEERIQSLGEPFYSNKEKGTGLGLMLCYKILKEHNGTIVFNSKEGFGTTAEVRVPIFLGNGNRYKQSFSK
ncbi:EAL domain-containing protein [Neobacillus sp. PS3-34]|uniref:EAL domain-containing protein n=1 Tax=Neobacillus sp. PS3-34 TaxID=3070678 RepID=UPI0027E024DB|nr:EAL domain-containing protein [Neobacillus sp. PS3-34]WML49522.1 EAL domain-containing protein [Neobacillus sp. PS3-34]